MLPTVVSASINSSENPTRRNKTAAPSSSPLASRTLAFDNHSRVLAMSSLAAAAPGPASNCAIIFSYCAASALPGLSAAFASEERPRQRKRTDSAIQYFEKQLFEIKLVNIPTTPYNIHKN